MKKILALAMVLGVIGVVMGGCGKKDDDAAEAAPATTAGAAAAPAAADAPAAK